VGWPAGRGARVLVGGLPDGRTTASSRPCAQARPRGASDLRPAVLPETVVVTASAVFSFPQAGITPGEARARGPPPTSSACMRSMTSSPRSTSLVRLHTSSSALYEAVGVMWVVRCVWLSGWVGRPPSWGSCTPRCAHLVQGAAHTRTHMCMLTHSTQAHGQASRPTEARTRTCARRQLVLDLHRCERGINLGPVGRVGAAIPSQ